MGCDAGKLNNEEREDKVNELIIAVNAAHRINFVLGGMTKDEEGKGATEDGLDIILEHCVNLANVVGQ